MEEQVNLLGEALRDVAALQRQSLEQANVLSRVRLRVPARRSAGQRLLARLPRLSLALPLVAAMGACLLWWHGRPEPLTFAVGGAGTDYAADLPVESRGPDGREKGAGAAIGERLEAPADRRLPLTFSDGSSVALDRGARARVIALDTQGATVRMESGRAEVNVRHRGNTRWQLQAGPFQVNVTGTRFSIDWDAQSEGLKVVMAEGTVEVVGPHLAGSAPVIVTAGQRFRATARESRWTLVASSEPELAPLGPVPTVAAVPEATGSPAAMTATPGEAPPAATSGTARASSSATRSWQALARAGRYQEALRAVERAGFDGACRKLGAEDLVQLGDVARLARNPARAEHAYQVARHRFPKSDRPAFALGLVAFEQRRDYRAAGKWFETYVRQYPSGPLAREALGREMESWHRAGEAARARRAARTYLSDAPTGAYAPLARQIVLP